MPDRKEILDKILNKKFNKSIFAGYEASDVDAFFDEVITLFRKEIDTNIKHEENTKSFMDKIKLLQKKIDLDMQIIADLKNEIKVYEKEGYGSRHTANKIAALQEQVSKLTKEKQESKNNG